jgi:YD repeat-containing protein
MLENVGKRAQMVDPSGTTAYTYDDLSPLGCQNVIRIQAVDESTVWISLEPLGCPPTAMATTS